MEPVTPLSTVLVDLPDEHVRAVRQRLAADALPAFSRAHLDGSCGTPYLVFHAPVADDAEGDVEACSPCAPDDPGAHFRPGGRFAATTVRGEDAAFPRVLEAYRRVADAAAAQHLEPCGPPRERYLPDGAVQVAWPVQEPQPGG